MFGQGHSSPPCPQDGNVRGYFSTQPQDVIFDPCAVGTVDGGPAIELLEGGGGLVLPGGLSWLHPRATQANKHI